MRSGLALILLLPLFACIKEEAKIAGGNASGDTSGGGSGETSSVSGTDPLAAEAWHLRNTGSNKGYSQSAGLSGEDLDVRYVHETLNIRGRNVRIAISDSGTQIDHPDLTGNSLALAYHRNYTFAPLETSPGNYEANPDWHGKSPLPALYDAEEAHGTAVAGLASAVGWNSIGSRGVAPGSKFGAFRFIFNYPSTETSGSFLAREIDQMLGDFHIFNYSYGPASSHRFIEEDDLIFETLSYGVSEQRDELGSIYIQSAGNSFSGSYRDASVDPDSVVTGNDPIYFDGNANAHETLVTPYKIVVGATNALGVRSSYSTPGSNLWVSAPGGEFGITTPAMISTDIQGCNAGMSFRNVNYPTLFNYGNSSINLQCDYTNLMNGTSSAAPVTAGVVALMLEANPALTWRDVKHILAITSEKIDGPNSLQDPTDYVDDPILNTLDHPRDQDVSGHTYDYKWVLNGAGHLFSNWYGFGRVNAANAVVVAQSYDLGSLGTFEQTLNSVGTWYYDSGTINLSVDEQDGTTGAEVSESRIWVGHNYEVEYAQIELVTDHPFPGDLAVILESPSGTESRLLTANSMLLLWNASRSSVTIPLGSSAFYEELSEGHWTLRVLDGSDARGAGTIISWKLLISGHRPVAERAYPYPPTSIILSSVPASDLTVTPVFSFTPATTSSVTYQASITTMSGLTEVTILNWTSIGSSTVSRQLSGLSLSGDTTYYLKLRSVNGLGRVSSTQLVEWRTPNI